MAAFLIEATEEHDCHYKRCLKGGKIAVGERAIKTQARHSNCYETYFDTVYYHEECYQMKGGK